MRQDKAREPVTPAGALNDVAGALWSIADALHGLYDVQVARYEKEFPEQGEVRDATITKLKTEEERLREEQGQSEETLEEWVGLREREFEDAAESKSKQGKGRATAPQGRRKAG